MKEYKRLTKRTDLGCAYCEASLHYSINRLAELEDKIENGTLVELPCKVGDKVYCVSCAWDINGKFVGKIHKARANGFYVSDGLMQIEDDILYDYFNLGGDVFLTKAEAEERIKELQNERD